MYFAIFLRSACMVCHTCFPGGQLQVCEGAKVSGQVASLTRTRPPFHGITVAPSSLFPSYRQIPSGSRWATNLAVARDLLMRSIDSHVAGMTAKAPLAVVTVSSLVVYSCSTEVAFMWMA